MIARAAIDSGVNFFAGYPITPASSVYTNVLNKLQNEAKVAMGASDEISALAMCIGASLKGAKSMTATSAPGLSLMVESIGYAFATETPVVIVLGQRLGPSTGAATQSAAGDISFVSNLISGGYQIPVIAPNSIFNCYEATRKAINLSETLRSPVILLTEKDVIMSNTSIDHEKFLAKQAEMRVEDRPKQDHLVSSYKNYDFDKVSDIPKFLEAGSGADIRAVVTASMHTKAGLLSKNSPEAFEVLDHLWAKYTNRLNEITYFDTDLEQGADTCILSFLASDLAAKQAVQELRKQGKKICHITLYSLFPIHSELITKLTSSYSKVIIPEENHTGQYADLIKAYISGKVIKVNQVGKLISPKLIKEAIDG